MTVHVQSIFSGKYRIQKDTVGKQKGKCDTRKFLFLSSQSKRATEVAIYTCEVSGNACAFG